MRRPAVDRGAASTEVVLLTPVLLFLVMLVIQFGLWYHAQSVAQAAAEQGVETARANGASATDGEQRARDFLAAAAPTLVSDTVVTADRDAEVATVTIDGESVDLLFGFSFGVHAEASSPVERFREDDREP